MKGIICKDISKRFSVSLLDVWVSYAEILLSRFTPTATRWLTQRSTKLLNRHCFLIRLCRDHPDISGVTLMASRPNMWQITLWYGERKIQNCYEIVPRKAQVSTRQHVWRHLFVFPVLFMEVISPKNECLRVFVLFGMSAWQCARERETWRLRRAQLTLHKLDQRVRCQLANS